MVLTDRQAVDMRASKAVGELHQKVAQAVQANRGQHAMAFRNALTDATRELSDRLVTVYSKMNGAFEPAVRDDLVAAIQARVSAFIKSSVATHGNQNASAATRLAANLDASHRTAIPHAFDLAVYESLKEAQSARPSPEREPRSIVQEALDLGPRPKIVRLLGSGAEADVYLVTDRFGREVAAKVFYASKRVPEHIYGHAVGLVRVPHPAVAELYSIDEVEVDGQLLPAILMEYLQGEELEMRLRRQVSLGELIDWGRTLLDVISAMHAADHFHADLHPGNLFVTDRGLRLYDVLHSMTAAHRSTRSKEAMRADNARHVRGILEAIFDKLPVSEASRTANKHFSTETRNVDLSLETIRRAFIEAVEILQPSVDASADR